MTLQDRLKKRIDLLSDFGISVDEVNDIICFHFNRRLDTPIYYLRLINIIKG